MEDVKEESSQNCSDSEDSSGSQSASTLEAEDVESDLESLEEHHYSNLRQYSATLERDFPAHYTAQQLSRSLLRGPLQDLCSLLWTQGSKCTGLLQRVLTHPAQGLVDEANATLLTQKLWVQALYTELLCTSSRHRAVREQEKQRPNGSVKIVCLPFDGAAASPCVSLPPFDLVGKLQCLRQLNHKRHP